jgi:hypothetical protein
VGFTEREAEAIARADLAFDVRYPARGSLLNLTRHFAPWAWLWAWRYGRLAAESRSLEQLGFSLHCAQDAIAHGRFGEKHLLLRAGWGRDPDLWEQAPAKVKDRLEAETRRRLRAYRAAC